MVASGMMSRGWANLLMRTIGTRSALRLFEIRPVI